MKRRAITVLKWIVLVTFGCFGLIGVVLLPLVAIIYILKGWSYFKWWNEAMDNLETRNRDY